MWLTIIFSALHVFGLGIGLPAVFLRGRALRRGDVEGVLAADTAWGLAAGLWLVSGLVRLFFTEKGWSFYATQPMFWLKMGLFAGVWALEAWPMITFVRWRIARGRGIAVDTSRMGLFSRFNDIELAIVLVMPFCAAAMARGWAP